MQVRKPQIDFDQVPVLWAGNRAFVQYFNAGSFVPAHIEPFLVKVLHRARPILNTFNKHQLAEVAIFMNQEMKHCKKHVKFNQKFSKFGYSELKPLEDKFASDFTTFLEKRSLRFNLAYCEGFEAISAFAVLAMFEESDEFFADADAAVEVLWKWHLAEEYEHRCVMHDVFHALYGRNPVTAYFWRIYGLFYAVVHIGTFSIKGMRVLLDKDRQSMSAEEVSKSRESARHVGRKLRGPLLRTVLSILNPFYKPALRRPPRGIDAYLRSPTGRPSFSEVAA